MNRSISACLAAWYTRPLAGHCNLDWGGCLHCPCKADGLSGQDMNPGAQSHSDCERLFIVRTNHVESVKVAHPSGTTRWCHRRTDAYADFLIEYGSIGWTGKNDRERRRINSECRRCTRCCARWISYNHAVAPGVGGGHTGQHQCGNRGARDVDAIFLPLITQRDRACGTQ